MRPLYIFDLDGTLALTEHRQHLVQAPPDCQKRANVPDQPCTCSGMCLFRPDWRAFFAACVDDEPNLPAIRTLQALRAGGAEVWIWSGRSDEVRTETVQWLSKHGAFGFPTGTLQWWPFGAPERFRMRAAGDHTPDEKLKFGWLADMEPPERNRLTAVFDDRDKVVAMWRAAGVPCFQVAPGDF